MHEYISDAVVLSRDTNGDLDCRFSIFTKKYGKIVVRAKSIRKITSKLSGHLMPGNIVAARVVEKNGLQIVDALKKGKIKIDYRDLNFLRGLMADFESDPGLWNLICGSGFNWVSALKILGWDPTDAICGGCDKVRPVSFNSETQEFFCKSCSSKLPPDKLIYIG